MIAAKTGELMFEIQRLKELAKAQKDKVPGMDVDQYLNFGAMPKNGNMWTNQQILLLSSWDYFLFMFGFVDEGVEVMNFYSAI